MTTAIGVILLLGGVIFFHELGHFAVAKFFNIYVEVFSIGFGKKLFRKKWGETEYCLSLFPLGGYVKMMGDDPYKEVPVEQAARAFSTQKLYKRFLVVAAGPIANVILAIVIFAFIFIVGKPMIGTQIGHITANSPAAIANIQAGSTIQKINGQELHYWREIEPALEGKIGQNVTLTIDSQDISMSVSEKESENPLYKGKMVPYLKGLSPLIRTATIALTSPTSLAAQAGIHSGDRITEVASKPIVSLKDLKMSLSEAAGQSVLVTLKRQADKKFTNHQLELALPEGATLESLGLDSAELYVHSVTPDLPAAKAGLKPNDKIHQVGSETVHSFEQAVKYIQNQGKKKEPVTLTVMRDGQRLPLTITPTIHKEKSPLGDEVERYIVGYQAYSVFTTPTPIKKTIRNPMTLLAESITETSHLTGQMLLSFGKIFTGDISLKSLGGPVLIATIAGKSLREGFVQFLQMMAVISINLFILNLLPIPVLDGGHLFFFTIEALKGSPVSIKTMEVANYIGISLLFMLMGLTFYNDIMRVIST